MGVESRCLARRQAIRERVSHSSVSIFLSGNHHDILVSPYLPDNSATDRFVATSLQSFVRSTKIIAKTMLTLSGADNLIKLWDVGQRTCVSTASSTAEVWGFDWQPAAAATFGVGKQFAVAGDDKVVTIYRAAGSV